MMKININYKFILSLILCSVITYPVISQTNKTTKDKSSNSNKSVRVNESLKLQSRSQLCTDIYTDSIVSSDVTVLGYSTLTSKNITVKNGGHLTLKAPIEVSINGPFEVLPGGALDVSGILKFTIRYTYDASGNRILREKNSISQ